MSEIEQKIEARYDELKLADRVTPGRTPWQTLRAQAEREVLTAEAEAVERSVMYATTPEEREARLRQASALWLLTYGDEGRQS